MLEDMSKGLFYVDMNGNRHKLCEVNSTEIVKDKPIENYVTTPITKSCSMQVDISYINRNLLLSLVHGRKVTNNWLKMHGGIMSRKKGR